MPVRGIICARLSRDRHGVGRATPMPRAPATPVRRPATSTRKTRARWPCPRQSTRSPPPKGQAAPEACPDRSTAGEPTAAANSAWQPTSAATRPTQSSKSPCPARRPHSSTGAPPHPARPWTTPRSTAGEASAPPTAPTPPARPAWPQTQTSRTCRERSP